MAHWLDQTPMLESLRDDRRLAEQGLRWLDAQSDAEAQHRALLETYEGGSLPMGVLWIEGLWEASGEDAACRTKLAAGPETRSDRGFAVQGGLYADRRHPDRLFYTPSDQIPPPLWAEVAPDAGQIAALLAEYHPAAQPARADLPATRRAYAGRLAQLYVPSPYSGQMEHAGPHELERHQVFSPFLQGTSWGSAYADDPWPETLDGISMLQRAVMSREMMAHAEGAVCSRTHRTCFSRAHVGLEFHCEGRYVWQVRYRPSAFPSTVRQFNQRFQTLFEEDLPIDAVGAMLGFGYWPRDYVQGQIAHWEREAQPGGVAFWLANLAALESHTMDALDLLRPYARSAASVIRATIINVCLEYNWRSLLEDMAFHETDPGIIAFFAQNLRYDFAPPPANEFGEPDDLWDGINDEDEEDEEAES